jgi:very-short-patch-repair endonuclease
MRDGAETPTDGNKCHHLPSDQISIDRRRRLRRYSTDAERALWRLLRGRHLSGLKFRGQQPIGQSILDFYCVAHNLAVELDGGQHSAPEGAAKDAVRTEFLKDRGIRVLRLSNRDVLMEPESAVLVIIAALTTPSP